MRARGAVGRAAVATLAVASLIGLASPVRAADPRSASYTDIPIQETGRVDHVLDGDTFRFIADGSRDWVSVRLLGVNTPEVTGFNNVHFAKNMCGGQEALRQLQQILPVGTRVQLRSSKTESQNRGRALRYAFALNPATGAYDIDVQAIIASSGLAMWFALDEEAALSYPYRVLIDEAQAAHRGIWSPTYCGPVEQADSSLSVVVSWDAPGIDQNNLNGEFVVVRNTGSSTVDVSGWLLRDSSLTSWFYFPQGSVLTPGDFRIVHVGSGTPGSPDPHDLYIGSSVPLFPNTTDGAFLGDGAYLLDHATAVRFHDEYPCRSDCTDPLQGVLKIVQVNAKSHGTSLARRANQEYVVVRNTGATPVVLDGYYLRRRVSTYPFIANTTLPAGASLTVRVGKGTATPTTQYWGQPSTLLNDDRDCVQLLSNTNVVLSERRW